MIFYLAAYLHRENSPDCNEILYVHLLCKCNAYGPANAVHVLRHMQQPNAF